MRLTFVTRPSLTTLAVLIASASSLAQNPGRLPKDAPFSQPADLLERVEASFGLRDSRLIELDASTFRGSPIRIPIAIRGQAYTAELSPVSVRAPEYQLLVQGADGDLTPAPTSDIHTYRGRLMELDRSSIAASMTTDGLYAVMVFPDDTTYGLEPLADRVAGASPRQHVLYPHRGLPDTGHRCATPDAVNGERKDTVAPSGGVASGSVLIAQLGIDSDVEYFQSYGSVAATEAQIHSIINTVNVQYERDLGVRHLITTIIVRTAEPDPYAASSVGGLINQFRDRWNVYHTSIVRDGAQLFTGKVLEGAIGIAFTNSLCFRDAAYSVVRSNSCSTFACKTDLSAHELGHIWSADHCSCPGWTMNATISSGNRFHPVFDIPEMIDFRDSRTCLHTGNKCDATGTVDCNENGVADGCDLAAGSSPDADADGTLDECQPPPMPNTETTTTYRNRAIALAVPTAITLPPGTPTALRLRIIELQNPSYPNPPGHEPPDFSSYIIGATCTDPLGCVRWIGKPQLAEEYQGRPHEGTFTIARLQCTPVYHDWTTEGFFHAVGAEIMPSSSYLVENLSPRCAGREDTCQWVSPSNWYGTARFGDVVAPYDPPDSGSQPDGVDVAALVNKFKALPGSPSTLFAVLQPNVPDWNTDVSALDIAGCVNAFRGQAYPFTGPCPCPSTVSCDTVPCASSGACNGGLCVHTCLGGDDAGQPCTDDHHCRNGACGPGFCRDRCARCSTP